MRAPILLDAFAGEGAQGNRAAVVELDRFPEVAAMQTQAALIGVPATAFLCTNLGNDAYQVRWFAPAREIALCGHGALAAGHVALAQAGADAVILRTADGRDLEIRRSKDSLHYELALPAIPTEPRDWPELSAALGEAAQAIRWNAAGYALALYDDCEAVLALDPDPAALAALGNIQVSATAAGGPDADITSRVFSSGGGEDAATGSAHAVLAPFWGDMLGLTQLSAFQASEQGGRFECRIEGDRVWLGGRCSPVT